MNLMVVAEGLETQEQVAFFREKGCEIGQGYFFSKPIPAQEAEALLLRNLAAAPGSQ
jgi:EAL domain-containing protein (putative c-di-GMP-specific phosphodiesterase class I)